MATVVLTPYGHTFCDGCLAGVGAYVCQMCRGAFVARVQVAAAMSVARNLERGMDGCPGGLGGPEDFVFETVHGDGEGGVVQACGRAGVRVCG